MAQTERMIKILQTLVFICSNTRIQTQSNDWTSCVRLNTPYIGDGSQCFACFRCLFAIASLPLTLFLGFRFCFEILCAYVCAREYVRMCLCADSNVSRIRSILLNGLKSENRSQ